MLPQRTQESIIPVFIGNGDLASVAVDGDMHVGNSLLIFTSNTISVLIIECRALNKLHGKPGLVRFWIEDSRFERTQASR